MRCSTPRCDAARERDGFFCAVCSERLRRVREEIESGKTERLRSAQMRRRQIHRSCAAFECPEWAKPGERHCLHHLRTMGP